MEAGRVSEKISILVKKANARQFIAKTKAGL